MKTREQELKHLRYLKYELIKKTKKEIKEINIELDTINGYKNLERQHQKIKNKKN
jgi:hypothetical protein